MADGIKRGDDPTNPNDLFWANRGKKSVEVPDQTVLADGGEEDDGEDALEEEEVSAMVQQAAASQQRRSKRNSLGNPLWSFAGQVRYNSPAI